MQIYKISLKVTNKILIYSIYTQKIKKYNGVNRTSKGALS